MPKITVVGAGFIGRAWAVSFARAGHEVALFDAAAGAVEAARSFVSGVLGDLAARNLLGGAAPADVLGRIRPAASLADALAGAAHVQENTPEDLAVKRGVFAELDALAGPETVLASSTSALLPSRFSEGLAGRARCLVAHPLNPPYLIPAVEIVPAPWTSPHAVERTRALMLAAGHAPIVMKRELDGFIVNRLQGALLEEAFRLVARGAASTEDVDAAVRDGLALRWSFMGPFETIDLNAPGGVADYVARYQSIYSGIFPEMRERVDWAGPVLQTVEAERRARVPKEKLPERQVWRDRQLMAIAAWRKAKREG